MTKTVSKSRFTADALAFFRQVERTGKPIVITDHGVPVLTLVPYLAETEPSMRVLRGSVLKYKSPTRPVDV